MRMGENGCNRWERINIGWKSIKVDQIYEHGGKGI